MKKKQKNILLGLSIILIIIFISYLGFYKQNVLGTFDEVIQEKELSLGESNFNAYGYDIKVKIDNQWFQGCKEPVTATSSPICLAGVCGKDENGCPIYSQGSMIVTGCTKPYTVKRPDSRCYANFNAGFCYICQGVEQKECGNYVCKSNLGGSKYVNTACNVNVIISRNGVELHNQGIAAVNSIKEVNFQDLKIVFYQKTDGSTWRPDRTMIETTYYTNPQTKEQSSYSTTSNIEGKGAACIGEFALIKQIVDTTKIDLDIKENSIVLTNNWKPFYGKICLITNTSNDTKYDCYTNEIFINTSTYNYTIEIPKSNAQLRPIIKDANIDGTPIGDFAGNLYELNIPKIETNIIEKNNTQIITALTNKPIEQIIEDNSFKQKKPNYLLYFGILGLSFFILLVFILTRKKRR